MIMNDSSAAQNAWMVRWKGSGASGGPSINHWVVGEMIDAACVLRCYECAA